MTKLKIEVLILSYFSIASLRLFHQQGPICFDLILSMSLSIVFHLILLFWGITGLKNLNPKFTLLKRLNCILPTS